MKKFSAFLLVVLLAVSLSACQAFHDDRTQEYPQDEPLRVAVFLQVKDIFHFDPAKDLAAWEGTMNAQITTTNNATDTDAPRIVEFKFRDTTTTNDTYAVDLTITNVPATVVKKTVRPFKIAYSQTVYNPIALLPPSDTFTYVVGYSAERRHSSSNAEQVGTDDEGNYVYLWTTGDTIEFTDVYPNRPLYYLLVIVGALVIGAAVYLFYRHNDCKKTQKPL